MTRTELKRLINIQKAGGASLEEAQRTIEILARQNGSFPSEAALAEVALIYAKVGRNLSQELADLLELKTGYFSIADCYKDLNTNSTLDKNTIRVVMHRWLKAGVVEKHPKKDGVYRRPEIEAPPIEWEDADISGTVDIAFPFELEKWVKIYPRNIICVAGAPNAGKTAMMLNMIKLNQDKFPISYFSNEMGAEELKLRLGKFKDVTWKFEARERSSNYADVIRPDSLNIIDYLEILADFYSVAGELKAIWEKLNKGIAIVALQKKRSYMEKGKLHEVDLGRGAEFGLEKPRLYLSMDNGKLKIVKAKNWVQGGVNPNNLTWRFSLREGTSFTNIQLIEGFIEDQEDLF